MTPEEASKLPRFAPHPLIKDLPKALKDPANFDSIQRRIYNTIVSKCGHSDIMQYAHCKTCTRKMLERRALLKRLGFKNPAQFMAWRKIMEEIKQVMPTVDWVNKKYV